MGEVATATGLTVRALHHGAIASVPFPGRLNVVVGRDTGARPGNMDLAVSNDFPSEAAFRAWGEDPEHVRVRGELLAPIAERVERCLFPV